MLMKYKDFKMLSRDDMKKVKGGNPEWVVLCHTHEPPGYPLPTCYESMFLCQAFCVSGIPLPCRVAEGAIDCA